VQIEALRSDSTVDPTLSGLASLFTTEDDDTTFVRPDRIRFVAGTADTELTFLLADSLALICQHPQLTDTSDVIEVLSGMPSRVQVLFPGEIPMPGTQSGKRGVPDITVFSVSDTVTFFARVTDSLYNPIPSSGVHAHFWVTTADSDTNHVAEIPDSLLIEGEEDTLFMIPRMSAYGTRIISHLSESEVQDSSFGLDIVAGPPSRLLVLFPGEEILPGDTTTNESVGPGKQGDAVTLYVGIPVDLTIYLVDTLWNPVVDVGPVLNHSIDVFAVPEIYGESNGPVPMDASGVITIQFTFVQDAFGDAFFLEAVDLDNSLYNSYLNMFSVDLMASWMGAWASSPEVPVGEIDTIWAQLLTPNNRPVPGREVQFSILEGNGTLIPTIAYTSSSGLAFSTYTPNLGASGEQVSILVQTFKMPGLDTTQILEQIVTFDVGGVVIDDIFGIYPNPLGVETEVATFAYDVPNDPSITRILIEIYDPFGERVWTKEMSPPEEGSLLGRRNTVEWDGRNRDGYRVASGVYLVSFRIYGGNRIHGSYKLPMGVIW
jgi:hypothetical protein